MRKAAFVAIAFGAVLSASAAAQDTIKIGLVLPYSGQFADTAAQMDNAIKLFMQKNGDTVAGKKVEILRRDTGGIAPDIAKRLAQELVVRENVDLFGRMDSQSKRYERSKRIRRIEKVDGCDECRGCYSNHKVTIHSTHVGHPVTAQ